MAEKFASSSAKAQKPVKHEKHLNDRIREKAISFVKKRLSALKDVELFPAPMAINPLDDDGDGDPDDRNLVENTKDFPWKSICLLKLFSAENKLIGTGTGWFVGPNTIITAAHNLYDPDENEITEKITLIPGCAGEQEPFQSISIDHTHFRIPSGFIEKETIEMDYAAIILPNNLFKVKMGFFGLACLYSKSLKNLSVKISGYPGEKVPANMQWYHQGRIASIDDNGFSLGYTIDTSPGQSGSPVWYENDEGEYHVVGIHSEGYYHKNFAIRFTERVFDQILEWREEGMPS